MVVHHKKVENIFQLSQQERCDYFIRKITDTEIVWGLFDDGWATAVSGHKIAIPFWPEEDFATLCASDEWVGFMAKAIRLSEFLSHWLPGMQVDGSICQIFPTPHQHGSLILPAALLISIKEEREQYE
ncbi:DUF2750 domain-containing protein [Pectobacterium zantedeschiae]|uniref:DUF2750 domain-containing protein n=1 Tax=Pectobacterium zantedeschiae TaxID=2034769 RepID=UPI00101B6B70|nr:DUF2750 domain-containing protein [Pectobacterium zantedeschiae]RYC47000.1 DUF2750 domain-containing protein [Pectobacterium zantedeschiae]